MRASNNNTLNKSIKRKIKDSVNKECFFDESQIKRRLDSLDKIIQS